MFRNLQLSGNNSRIQHVKVRVWFLGHAATRIRSRATTLHCLQKVHAVLAVSRLGVEGHNLLRNYINFYFLLLYRPVSCPYAFYYSNVQQILLWNIQVYTPMSSFSCTDTVLEILHDKHFLANIVLVHPLNLLYYLTHEFKFDFWSKLVAWHLFSSNGYCGEIGMIVPRWNIYCLLSVMKSL